MNRFGLCNFCYNIYFVIKSTELFTNANSIENANSDVRYMPEKFIHTIRARVNKLLRLQYQSITPKNNL